MGEKMKQLRDFEKEMLHEEEAMANPEPSENPGESYPSGWGDSEHDTRLHRNLKPHTCPPEYDAKHHHYRDTAH